MKRRTAVGLLTALTCSLALAMPIGQASSVKASVSTDPPAVGSQFDAGKAEAGAESDETSDTDAEALAFMKEGVRLFRAGDFPASREQFMAAWKRVKHWAIAANLAEVELKLGLYRQAAEHLSFALSQMPADPADADLAEDRADLRTKLNECKKHVSTLVVIVDQSGATICVDGRNVGTSPLAAEIFVDPGVVAVSAELAGFSTASRMLRTTAGAHVTATLKLKKRAEKRDRSQLGDTIDCRTWIARSQQETRAGAADT